MFHLKMKSLFASIQKNNNKKTSYFCSNDSGGFLSKPNNNGVIKTEGHF